MSDIKSSPDKDAALDAYWRSKNPEVRRLIVAQGELNLQARLAASGGLEQRLAQAAAFMLAAAAFSAGLAFGNDARLIVKGLAVMSTIAFVLGGSICAVGVATRSFGFAGIPPAFWANADIAKFDMQDAEYWRLGHIVDSIWRVKQAGRRRGLFLNVGLDFGIAGGVLISACALLALTGAK